MKVELIACSRPLPGQCGTVTNLIGVTPNPMRVIEQAASVCYDSKPDFWDFKIAHNCAKTGHLSVYEHIYFTFHIEGISRACLAQLTRHRHFSFSVRSQRYCDESHAEPILPTSTNEDQDGVIADAYDYAWDAYDRLIKDGVAKEDARMVLPNGAPTELYHLVWADILGGGLSAGEQAATPTGADASRRHPFAGRAGRAG